MNRLPDVSAGLERLNRAAEGAADDDPRAATFVRGLVLGALVGAAIAGSTIWQRRRQGAPTSTIAPTSGDATEELGRLRR